MQGQYAIYNTAPYAEQKARGVGFANPKNNFYSFFGRWRACRLYQFI